MKKSILNLGGAEELSKNEQKSVGGGLLAPVDAGSECRIYVTGSGWSSKSHSVAQAQFLYNSAWTFNDGSKVTGYCCASC